MGYLVLPKRIIAVYYLPIKVESIDDDDDAITIATINQLTGLGQQDEIYLSTKDSK